MRLGICGFRLGLVPDRNAIAKALADREPIAFDGDDFRNQVRDEIEFQAGELAGGLEALSVLIRNAEGEPPDRESMSVLFSMLSEQASGIGYLDQQLEESEIDALRKSFEQVRQEVGEQIPGSHARTNAILSGRIRIKNDSLKEEDGGSAGEPEKVAL